MFGFGKKKKTTAPPPQAEARMHVIPDIFYGGNDPVIYHASAGQGPASSHTSTTRTASPGLTKPESGSWFVGRKKIVVIALGGSVLLCIIGVSAWYYVSKATSQLAVVPTEQVKVPIPDRVPEVVLPEEVIDSATTTVASEEVEQPEVSIPEIEPVSFPRILLIDAPDTDADELTDDEEVLFGTNQDVWDTDKDGYYDGQEVANLYNPNGLAPVKLIDSGLVTEYLNPIWKYRTYYPASWQVGQVDPEGRQILLSTLSGDFIEIRVFSRVPGMSFQDWFATSVEGETFQDILPITNRFLEQGWKRKDGLVAYFLSDTFVTVLIYHPGVTGAVAYRHVMNVAVQSFRPTKSSVNIPDQVVLPEPPTFATGGVSTPDDGGEEDAI
jgi:hypothetical protein